MRQLVFLGPGAVEWRDVAEPRLGAGHEALVRPVAATLCDLDCLALRGGTPFVGPFPLGHECVAEVVGVGPDVEGWAPGDVVIVPWHVSCYACRWCDAGLPVHCRTHRFQMYGFPLSPERGCFFSDLVLIPHADSALVRVPAGLSPTALASVSDNVCVGWQVTVPQLADAPGSEVLVMGGGGSVAMYAVQFALAAGAARVDYVDSAPERLRLAESLGATVIEGPPPRQLGPYPISVDSSIDRAALACALRSTSNEGVCFSTGIFFEDVALPLWEMYLNGVTFHIGVNNPRPDIPEVLDYISGGRVRPELVTSEVLEWDDIPRAVSDPSLKPVFLRESLFS
jgi:threonine dehydrogenase-like Zn-dependent dehydrogenase